MRELNEGFNDAFGAVGIDYDKAEDMVKIADVVSNALYEAHEIMTKNDLYEKYLMKNEFNQEGGNIFHEYDRLLSGNLSEALTQKTDSGHTYVSTVGLGNALTESSLQAATEVLNETIGKEYPITFSYEGNYSKSQLLYEETSGNKYELLEGDSLSDIISELENFEEKEAV